MIKKIILTTIILVTAFSTLLASEFEKLWGISKNEFESRLKPDNYTSFKPEENPGYSNKIIDFFSSMNPEERAVINIIQIPGTPVMDYCFFNEKLYSITEEWGNLDRTGVNNLLKQLREKYSEPSIDGKNPETLYSYKKNKTKVLLYKKAIDEKSVQIKIFYYSTDLFRMFLIE